VEFQLVVLHPHQFLPSGLSLQRKTGNLSWTQYIVAADGLLHATQDYADTNSEIFPLLTYPTTREPLEQLNPWFVIMNAGIKFERFSENYGLDKLPTPMGEIAKQTLEIVELIYARIQPSQKYLERVPDQVSEDTKGSTLLRLCGVFQLCRCVRV
jgi:hypothetical protein